MTQYLPALLGGQASKDRRALARMLGDVQAAGSVEVAQVRTAAQVAVAKIEAVEDAGHVGIAAATNLAAHRRWCIQQDPTVAGCVDCVTETAVCGIAEQIGRLGRSLG